MAVLAVGLLAGVVGGYMWKKKNIRKGKMYVVTQIHDFLCLLPNTVITRA